MPRATKQAVAKRRWAIIALLAEGYERAHIAQALNLSGVMVDRDITAMCGELGAKNTPHLIAQAFRAGNLE